ncbi:MAG: ABC transporter permease [Saprospiraceae bacterium]
MELPVRVYSAENKHNLKSVLLEGLQGYRDGFYLATQIFVREFKASYRTTYFGALWALYPTLSAAIIWIFLRGTGVVSSAETGLPYPLYVLAGTTVWAIITECLSEPLQVFNANQSIITKINFSKEALVILSYFNLLYRTFFKVLLIALLLFFFNISPSFSLLLFLPLLAIVMIALVSIGVLLLPVEILMPDISRLKNAALPFLLYAAPVVYARPESGLLATVINWNPFTYIIEGLRNSMTGQAVQNPMFWITLCAIAAVAFIVSTVVFRIAAPIIIQRLSA